MSNAPIVARSNGHDRFLVIALSVMLSVAGVCRAVHAATIPVEVSADNVQARITLSSTSAKGGGELGYTVDFSVAPGWHIYGEPLPEGEGLTPTAIKFESKLIANQNLKLPKPTMLHFAALNQTYPVYQGDFQGAGRIGLAPGLKAGDYVLTGTLTFQECNDALCKMPQSAQFEIPLKID